MADKKTKAGKLLKKAGQAIKKKVKDEAVGALTDAIRDRSTDQSHADLNKVRVGGGRKARPDYSVSGKFELKGNKKKRKQKKKIAKWEKQRKSQAAAGVGTKAFLELDKKYKSGK